jgi:Cu+-exporting ATPase
VRLLNKGNLFIKMNLCWAFAYNLVMLPITTGMFYSLDVVISPIISSIAMSVSSIVVVCFSNLLSCFHYDDSFLSNNLQQLYVNNKLSETQSTRSN